MQNFGHELLSEAPEDDRQRFPRKGSCEYMVNISVVIFYIHLPQNRYRELMCVSRQWRDLLVRKRFGFGHETNRLPGNGDLALFCPACPQPDVNLPADWKNDPDW